MTSRMQSLSSNIQKTWMHEKSRSNEIIKGDREVNYLDILTRRHVGKIQCNGLVFFFIMTHERMHESHFASESVT